MTTVEQELTSVTESGVVDLDLLMFLGPEVCPEEPAPALPLFVPQSVESAPGNSLVGLNPAP